MSRFSDLLSHYITKSGLTIKYLAEISGFDASHITHIKKGTRKPVSQDKFIALVQSLQLTPTDQEKLLDAYYVDKIGEEKYTKYEAVMALIKSGDEFPKIQVPARYDHDLTDISVIQRNSNVVNILGMVVEEACAKDSGSLRIMAQPDSDQLMDLLFKVSANHPAVSIQHIVSLQSSQAESDAAALNVNRAKQMLFLMRQGERYFPNYYYEKSVVSQDHLMLFPNVIVTEKNVLCISADYERGVLHSEQHIIDFYRNLFEEQLSKCHPFGMVHPTLLDTMNIYTKIIQQSGQNTFQNLCYQPCLMPFAKAEHGKYLAEDVSMAEEILSQFFTGYQRVLWQSYIIDCFTLDGMYDFLNTGVITHLRGYMNPLPLDDRKQFILDMLQAVEEKQREIHIVRPRFIKVPESLAIMCANSNDAFIEFIHASDKASSLAFAEQSISNAVADFMRFLPKSPFVYSNEKSVRMVKDAIK